VSTVKVGFLGGPHDGREQDFPVVGESGLPAPVMETMEPTLTPGEYQRTIIDGDPAAIPDQLFRPVAYRLVRNGSLIGPRLYYAHPSVRIPLTP
jgi:hypothetical protein